MYSVYVLYSEACKKYYVGYTDNIDRRLMEYNELSENTFTSKHRPWLLKAIIEISENRAEAMKVEKYIKGQKRSSFIKMLIEKQKDEDFKEWLMQKIKGSAG